MSHHVPGLDHSDPSTIRVGPSLLFAFKGVCVEEGIKGFPLFTFRPIFWWRGISVKAHVPLHLSVNSKMEWDLKISAHGL